MSVFREISSGEGRATATEAILQPFRALRAAPEFAAEVLAPPYDVLSVAEARAAVRDRPRSFLHVSRAEVDFPEDTDPYAPEVYSRASENFRSLQAGGVLRRDPQAAFYVYRLGQAGHEQTGVAAAASVAAYERGDIRIHEHTRPQKETDRVKHMEALNAQTGPVILVHRPNGEIGAWLQTATAGAPNLDVQAPDGVRHTLWLVTDKGETEGLAAAFSEVGPLYVADGHHRSAAAARVAAGRRGEAGERDVDWASQRFLAVAFPSDEMQILPYNRVVRDLAGLDASTFLARIEIACSVVQSAAPVEPNCVHEFGMYLLGTWYRLKPKLLPPEGTPPLARLDVGLLSSMILRPVLGISDPRSDPRIDFVGGARGLEGLADRVNSGDMAVAFALYPTRIEDLMAVADAGEVMPPKSTWFEPKLADGLISAPLD